MNKSKADYRNFSKNWFKKREKSCSLSLSFVNPCRKFEELCGYERRGMPSSPEQRVVQRLDLIREVSLCAGWWLI